jgi:hypothetical protein
MPETARPDEGFERLLTQETRDRTLPWKRAAWIAMSLIALVTFALAAFDLRKAALTIVVFVGVALWGPAMALPGRGGRALLYDRTEKRLRWQRFSIVATVLLFPAALYALLELGLALHRALGV